MENLKVTSIEDLKKYSEGQVVQLPDFAEGQPLVVKMKRPSMLVLAKQRKIPNALLNVASEMFASGTENIDLKDENLLSNLCDVCEVIAEASLVSPTLAEIQEAGLNLSDNQYMAIFSYCQNGIEGLKPFL